MSLNYSKFEQGINLTPQNTNAPSTKGDVRYNSTTDQLEYYNGALVPIVTGTTPVVDGIVIDGATSGTLTLTAGPTTTSYGLQFPAADGTSGQVLSTNGDGTSIWRTVSGVASANDTLSNLASPTDINQDLLFSLNNAKKLGWKLTGGNLGIKAPSSSLSGDVTLTLPATAGTSGQFLTTNGSGGILSWSSVSAANPALSNLTSPTSINQNLTFANALTQPHIVISSGGSFFVDNAASIVLGTASITAGDGIASSGVSIDGGNTSESVGGRLILTASTASGVSPVASGRIDFSNGGGQHTRIQSDITASTYTLTLPTSAGSSGQLLTTDGSGILSWSATATSTNARYKTIAITTIPTAPTFTTIRYTSQDYDTNSAYNTATGEYTIPTTGIYQIAAQVAISGTSDRRLAVYVNGSQIVGGATVTGVAFVGINVQFKLTTTDVVTIRALQSSGGNESTVTDTSGNFFTIMKVGV